MRSRQLWISVCIGLCPLLVGCGGDKDEPSAEAPAPAAPTIADSATDGADGASQSGVDDAAPAAPAPDEADAALEEEPELATGFKEDLQRVLELERETQFNRAMAEARELRKKYRTGPESEALGHRLTQLGEYMRRSRNLPYAVRKLGPESTFLERKVAREKIDEAGELGLIYLRKAVRDRPSIGIANEAAKMLIEAEKEECVPFLIRQLDDPPEEPLLGTLVGGISEHAEDPGLQSLLTLVQFRHSDAPEEYRDDLLEGLRQATRRDFDTGDLNALYNQVQQDEGFDKRHVVELLALIYESTTARHDEAFDELLGGEGRLDELRAYADRARAAEDEIISDWGHRISLALAFVNFRLLREGLVAWWSFDDIERNVVRDDSGNGHEAKVIAQRQPALRKGGIGQTIHLKHSNNGMVESVHTRGNIFHNLHRGSYGFAAWINPASIPDGEQPDPYWGIVTKEGWHLGLLAKPDGTICHEHYYRDRAKPVTACSEPVLEPGTWLHVVGTVDHMAGTVRLYINGKLVSEGEFPKGRIADLYNRRPVRVGAARLGPGDYACRFSGLIDEVAIYNRSLTQDDVKNLYRVRSVGLREGLKPQPETETAGE